MQVDIPFDAGSILTVCGFIGAIIWQSAILKRNLEMISSRITKVEDDMSKITSLLIAQEGVSQRLASTIERLAHIEQVILAIHTDAGTRLRRPSARRGT